MLWTIAVILVAVLGGGCPAAHFTYERIAVSSVEEGSGSASALVTPSAHDSHSLLGRCLERFQHVSHSRVSKPDCTDRLDG